MCFFRCTRKVHLFCSFLLFITAYIILITSNILLFSSPKHFINNHIYFTDKYKIHYVDIIFNISIVSMFVFLLIITATIENAEYNIMRISRLRAYKRFLEEENVFLKERMIISSRIKKIVTDYFIENGDSKCSICLSDMKINSETFLTFCGHLYHKKCIDESLNYSNKCPYCRTNINYSIED